MPDSTARQPRPRKPRLRLVPPPKTRPEEAGGVTINTPAGFREGDRVTTVCPEDDAHACAGLYAGDVGVLYRTQDVRASEVAAVSIGGLLWLGTYRPAPGGYMTLERDGETARYKPGEVELIGRVVHVERDGEIPRRLHPFAKHNGRGLCC